MTTLPEDAHTADQQQTQAKITGFLTYFPIFLSRKINFLTLRKFKI